MARILQVCNTDFYLEKFLQPLVRALVAGGHEVTCVCEITAGKRAPDVGAEVMHVAFPRGPDPLGFHRATAEIRRLVRARGIELVNGHNRNASICARIAAWREGVVNLYTAHGFYFHDDQSRLARELTIALEGALGVITDFTLSQAEEDATMMVRRRLLRGDRVETIGNGIDTERFVPSGGAAARRALEESLGLAPDRFRVCSVGRVVRGKGFGDLLEAFARAFPGDESTELVIVGGNIAQDISPYAREFEARARQLGVGGRLRTTGIVHDVERWLAASDVFVLPSYREGMPRALIEAMSAGLACVATDIRGCREIVHDGVDGLLYAPHDVGTLAERLVRVRQDPALATRLGTAARSIARERFDERGYVRRQVDALERVAKKHGAPSFAPSGARS